MINRKIKPYHIFIAIVVILGIVFNYLLIKYIRMNILITQPILADYNDSDRQIFEEELGIKFVKNAVITEAKYLPSLQDSSFYLVFNFPEDEIDEFYKGIADHYRETQVGEPITPELLTLDGVFLKVYYHTNREFTSLGLYDSDENTISVFIDYNNPGSSLINALMNKVR